MIRVKEQYANGEHHWTEEWVIRVQEATELALSLSGNYSCLGEWCGVQGEAVGYWLQQGVIPAKHVPAVSAATGVPRDKLRPDVYQFPANRVSEYHQFCAARDAEAHRRREAKRSRS